MYKYGKKSSVPTSKRESHRNTGAQKSAQTEQARRDQALGVSFGPPSRQSTPSSVTSEWGIGSRGSSRSGRVSSTDRNRIPRDPYSVTRSGHSSLTNQDRVQNEYKANQKGLSSLGIEAYQSTRGAGYLTERSLVSPPSTNTDRGSRGYSRDPSDYNSGRSQPTLGADKMIRSSAVRSSPTVSASSSKRSTYGATPPCTRTMRTSPTAADYKVKQSQVTSNYPATKKSEVSYERSGRKSQGSTDVRRTNTKEGGLDSEFATLLIKDTGQGRVGSSTRANTKTTAIEKSLVPLTRGNLHAMSKSSVSDDNISLDEPPSTNDVTVQKFRNAIKQELQLEKILEWLRYVGEYLRIAINAAADRVDPLIQIQECLFDILKVCDQVGLVLHSFRLGANDILEKLHIAYCYILDGFPDLAKSDIDSVSRHVSSMESKAQKAFTVLQKARDGVRKCTEMTGSEWEAIRRKSGGRVDPEMELRHKLILKMLDYTNEELRDITTCMDSLVTTAQNWCAESNQIVEPVMAKNFQTASKLSRTEQKQFWGMLTFKQEAVNYLCRWRALQVYCNDTATKVRPVRGAIDFYYTETLYPREAVKFAWKLAKKITSKKYITDLVSRYEKLDQREGNVLPPGRVKLATNALIDDDENAGSSTPSNRQGQRTHAHSEYGRSKPRQGNRNQGANQSETLHLNYPYLYLAEKCTSK